MATRTHHKSHTFRPIRNAVNLVEDLVKIGFMCFIGGMLTMLIIVLYFHI